MNIQLQNIFKPDEEYADEFRPIKDTLTDFVNDNFLKYNRNELALVKLIFEVFNAMIKEVRKKYKLTKYDLVFVFKGGNVLRIINNNMMDYFPQGSDEIVRKIYLPYLKQSDNDFSVYLNPNLGRYKEISEKLMWYIYEALNKIREIYLSDLPHYFDIYNLSRKQRSKLTKKLIDDLNKTEVLKVHSVRISPTFDKFIKFDKDENIMVHDIQNKPTTAYYNSVNQALKFASPAGGVTRFDLARTKINFQMNESINQSGELIDVSVPKKEDYQMQVHNTTKRFHKFVKKNIIQDLYNEEYDFKYNLINMHYIIHDLMNMLYIGREFPWEDRKYAKRVNRLMYFVFLDILDKIRVTPDNLDVIKDVMDIFKKSLKNTKLIKDIHQMNLILVSSFTHKIKDKKHSKVEYDKYIKILEKNVDSINAIIKNLKKYLQGFKLGKQIYKTEKIV